MHIDTCVTLWDLLKTKQKHFFHFCYPFLGTFSTLPSAQTIKDIGLIFFYELALKKLGCDHAFQHYVYSLRLYIDSDLAFAGLMNFKKNHIKNQWDET